MTVRRAVTQLIQEEVAYAEQGRGTFVKTPQLDSATFDLGDLRRYLADPDIAARIVEARIVTPSTRVRDKLKVDADDRVIAIKRLLCRGEEAVFYHSEYLIFDPARPLVEAELRRHLAERPLLGRRRLRCQVRSPDAARLGPDRGRGRVSR